MASRKGKPNVISLATRDKYRELARQYGDPMLFGFIVLNDPNMPIEIRLHAMRCLLPYGEARQMSLRVETAAEGRVELAFDQADMLVDTEGRPELIPGAG